MARVATMSVSEDTFRYRGGNVTNTRRTLYAVDGRPILKAVILDFAPPCESDLSRERVLRQSFPDQHFHYVVYWPITEGVDDETLSDATRAKLVDIFANGTSYDRILLVVRQGANDTITDLLTDEIDRVSGGDIISVAHVFEDMILSPCIGEGMRWSPDMNDGSVSALA